MNCAIEICIEADSPLMVESVKAAVMGGAQRIELCAQMDLGGTTPSADAIRQASIITGDTVELLVMIRPRGGDFYYSRSELGEMISSINVAADAGADGVVFGALSPSDEKDPRVSINSSANTELVSCAKSKGLKTTFHRAIDALPDPGAAAVVLHSLGFDRILTSGIPWEAASISTASASTPASRPQRLRTLGSVFARVQDVPRNEIEIVLAGGISPLNAASLIREFEPFSQHMSLHAYSGVRVDGQTDQMAVSQLVSLVA